MTDRGDSMKILFTRNLEIEVLDRDPTLWNQEKVIQSTSLLKSIFHLEQSNLLYKSHLLSMLFKL